ncbi:hypothetical protein B9J78_02985 [bacterium Unc6]|nr:hypothetical protein [bacterium Unc6]
MNILQLLPQMNVGGVETGTLDLSKYLVKKGHRCVVASGGGLLTFELENHSVKHYELPIGVKNPFLWHSLIKKIVKIIKDEQIQIVHARSRVPAIIGYIAARKTGVEFITTCHGYYSYHPGSFIMTLGKRVIVPSTFMGRYIIETFNVPPDRVRLVHRGVDIERFPYFPLTDYPKTKSFKVAMIGRITPLKGHKDFLQGLKIVVQNFKNLKYQTLSCNDIEGIIVGDAPEGKPYKRELEEISKQLSISNNVHFICSQYNISDIMQKIDALVLASRRPEAFGRVIIEAQASGVPVIAVHSGGVLDIVENEKTGLIIPSEDPTAMAEAIIKLIKNPDIAKQISINARKNVEQRFTLEHMAENTIKVYEEVLKEKRILILKLSALGDVLLSIPSIRALRENLPHARIDVLVDKRYVDVFQRCPYINNCLVWDTRKPKIKNLMEIVQKIKPQCYDMSIDFQNNKTTHIISFLSFIGSRYGYKRGWGRVLLNKGITFKPSNSGPIEHQWEILKQIGIIPKYDALEFWTTNYDEEFADMILKDAWLTEGQILFGISAWASSDWKTKIWKIENYAELANRLGKEFNGRVLITGTKDREKDARLLAGLIQTKPINLVGKTTVSRLAAIFKKCKVVVTVDSASMHLASAVGVPTIAIFGPTNPRWHIVNKNISVLQSDIKCINCYRKKCKNIKCMQGVTVPMVMEEVKKVMGQ